VRQVLIFDADDTLWENNVRYERVIEDFLDWLAHPTYDKAALREILNDVQRANAITHGYGRSMLLRSLGDVVGRLRERPATEAEHAEIAELAAALIHYQVELVPGVDETLTELGTRHDLLLLTKGEQEEQQGKLDHAKLEHHFRSVHIVYEKDTETYLRLAAELSLTPASTWMIGNSPKSDILPARRAGMNAVFIPNKNTWVLDHDELDPSDDRVLQVKTFPELLAHF
jgi:putative hydrolase of the HAD superfamily